jgi:hypothetical protein
MSSLQARERVEVEKAVQILSKVEGEIRDLVRRDAASPWRPLADCTDLTDSNIGSLLQGVSGNSLREIDGCMTELHTLRHTLQTEAARMQREMIRYAALNQAATESLRTISERLTFCKKK